MAAQEKVLAGQFAQEYFRWLQKNYATKGVMVLAPEDTRATENLQDFFYLYFQECYRPRRKALLDLGSDLELAAIMQSVATTQAVSAPPA